MDNGLKLSKTRVCKVHQEAVAVVQQDRIVPELGEDDGGREIGERWERGLGDNQ